MLGWLTGPGAWRTDEFGPVCPSCGRYDWTDQKTMDVPCRSGTHRARRCEGCEHFEVRYYCREHG